MKANVKRGSKQRAKTAAEAKRDVKKTVARRKPGSRNRRNSRARPVNYPIAETLRWVAQGEMLLIKWGAIKSPGAKRIAGTVANLLGVLEALMELRKR